MTEAPLTSQIQTVPAVAAGAKLMEKVINGQGGIGKNHRPLKVIICDDKFVAAGAIGCARTAVSNHAAAVIGGYNQFGDLTDPILSQAHIPYFYPPGLSSSDFTSSNSFPAPNGFFGLAAGFGAAAVSDNCKKVRLLVYEPAEAFFVPLAEATYRAAGGKGQYAVTVVPVTANDYGPYVAAALSNRPDCLSLIEFPIAASLTMRAYVQQKIRVKHIYACYGCTDMSAIAASGGKKTVLNGADIFSTQPVWSNNRALAQLKKYAQRYHASQAVINQNPDYLIRTYEGFAVFAAIANRLNNVTASTFLKALKNLRQIPQVFPGVGLMKGANWRKSFPYKGFNRLPGGSWVMHGTIKDGQFVNTSNNVYNIGAIVTHPKK
jgi:ABC-type branched-subunit amino acid transport system substrate-binding protein